MKIIVKEGGSPYGITTIEEWVNGCQRKVALRGGSSYSLGTLTGTLVHALLETYYSKGYFETENVSWRGVDLTDPLFSQAETKAFHVFREYKMKFPPNELGCVLEVEWGFEINVPHVIGCAPFTGRIDLIIKLTKRDCIRLRKTRGIDLEPGIYIVDHKTAGGIYATTFERLSNGIQPTAYMKAFPYVTGKRVQGALMNVMTTTRDVKFHTLVIPRPGVLDTNRLFSVTESEAMKSWGNFENSRPNISRCYDYNGICGHWVNAQCTGV